MEERKRTLSLHRRPLTMSSQEVEDLKKKIEGLEEALKAKDNPPPTVVSPTEEDADLAAKVSSLLK